ncbi:hypothetical protein H0H92_015269 [Tricholoma furcatifolium]|nr:hypothetical protein H0H92_015269 [Tricholoma furcatifolium]
MPAPTSVRVVVHLPWDRPETNALPDPPPIEWNSEKADILWKYIERSRSSDSGGPDWKGLAAHLDVPLPYLLYRVNARFQEEIRGLKDIQGALSPTVSQPTSKLSETGSSNDKSPISTRPTNRLLNSSRLSGPLSKTPLGIRARLNSLGNNSPKPKKAMSSSTLTLQAQKMPSHTPGLQPTSPSSSEGTDSEEEAARKEEDADRDAEEQEALDRKLQQLQEMITNDGLGLVSSSRPRKKGKGLDRGRSGQESMAGSYRQDGLSSSSLSSASPQGSIPDIPSPPPESQTRPIFQRRMSASKSASPPAISPRSALGQRYRPLVDRTTSEHSSSHGSEASSFSDLSDASLSDASALESALMSNIRGGGSRLMNLTFVTELGESFTVDIDPNMELENVMALLEAESGIPIADQSISIENRVLNDPKKTMSELGVGDKAMLMLRRTFSNPAGQPIVQDSEMMRLQTLGNPDLMRQLRENAPEIAEAAQNNPQRFAEYLRQVRERQYEAELEQQREIALLNADPFNIEAQAKIEEAIRMQGVLENYAHAMEYSPESFARVTMLYVPIEVNGHPIKAFVDSGAQSTIMSPACAEACGIMRLIDKRYEGIAMGVGTATILGRVHTVPLKLADLHLPCAISIVEGDVDLLFGLDMLKAHQACIDLEKNVLRIKGREVQFLPEHELPERARDNRRADDLALGTSASSSSRTTTTSSTTPSLPQGQTSSGTSAIPAGQPAQVTTPIPQQTQSRYPEEHIQTLMGLGVTREVAIRSLEATGGNLDVAASLLFQ